MKELDALFDRVVLCMMVCRGISNVDLISLIRDAEYPARTDYVQENATSLLKMKDIKILRQRAALKTLNDKVEGLKRSQQYTNSGAE